MDDILLDDVLYHAGVKGMKVAGKIAQVLKSAGKTGGRTGDAHIVPHGVADGGPVLGDQGGVVVVLVALVVPVFYILVQTSKGAETSPDTGGDVDGGGFAPDQGL